MSDIALFSGLNSKFNDYVNLIDTAMVEIESRTHRSDRTSCNRLINLLESLNVPVEESTLNGLIFTDLMMDLKCRPIDDFTSLVALLKNGDQPKNLLKRLNKMAGHLESERAMVTQRMAR